MVAPVDQPLVSAATVRLVLEAWRRTRAPIVRPAREGRHGHPVLFDRALFDALRRADPSAGARGVVRAHADRAVDVPVDDDGAFADIDTPEDYARWIGLKL
jgi:molybdenum cofactor cytidylyltransferase